MDERGAGEPRYTAFLSYSHKDAAAAARLHRRLETYRLPKRLVGTPTTRGPVPERLLPIFRDRDELPAATDLSETVREALAQSGSLIVLCSPYSAASLWVAEEIEVFRNLHPDRPVLAAVLSGDPPDCFPKVMRAYGQDGTWHEPLATDLRRGGDGPQLGLLKLVAGITGVGLDALVQRDAQRKIRRVMAVTAFAVLAVLVMGALALVALSARREAERQRAEAEGQIEFMMTDLRTKLRSVGRLDIMTAVNQRALAYYDGQELGALSPNSLERRARVLLALGEDNLTRDRTGSALSAFREAHRTTEEQLKREPDDPDRIFAHSQSEYWVGYVEYTRRNRESATRAWQRYKALTEKLLELDATNPRWLREAGYAAGNLCTIAVETRSDASAARRICSEALARMEAVRKLRVGDLGVELDVANRHAWLADAWNMDGHWDRALYHRREQERLARHLIAREPRNLDYQDFWMRTQFTFGQLLNEHGQSSEAQRWIRGAAATAENLRSQDPENASWRSIQQQIERATQ